jgi:hypothetical protein
VAREVLGAAGLIAWYSRQVDLQPVTRRAPLVVIRAMLHHSRQGADKRWATDLWSPTFSYQADFWTWQDQSQQLRISAADVPQPVGHLPLGGNRVLIDK